MHTSNLKKILTLGLCAVFSMKAMQAPGTAALAQAETITLVTAYAQKVIDKFV